MKRFKSFKVKSEASPSYTGPIYYRVFGNVRSRAGRPFILEYDPTDAARKQVLFDHRVRYHSILSSGLIVDERRNLLPEWQVPLKAKLAKGAEVSYEFAPSGFASERVRDLIESLDPGLHIFIPIDLTLPDGTVERLFKMMWSDDFFGEAVPILDIEANRMERQEVNGVVRYYEPDWARSMTLEPYHFGYLNPKTLPDLNVFGTSNLDNSEVMSEPLVMRLEEMGVTIPKHSTLVAMGVAH
jgi:hypothetical protein